jgi:site-specific DNA-methyltransferase (adenine-specific)
VNEIFHEDCLDTLTKRKIEYDYVCFSPPDYDELNLTPIKDDKEYLDWQKEIYSKLNPTNNVVTIVTSLRRFKARTIPKDYHVYEIMKDLGYYLITKKVWIKPKIDINLGERNNLYRYDYAMVQNFGRGKIKSRGTKRYRADNWTEDYKMEKFGGVSYTYHFPETMISRCIVNFTDRGDTVYDPFIGIGTTAIASYTLGRNYYGSEIDEKIYNIAHERTENLKNIAKKT